MPRFIGAGGIPIRAAYPSAREGGMARGPFPSNLAHPALRTPQPLTPAQQVYARPEILGPAETVGGTGEGRAVASGAPTGAGTDRRGAGGPVIRGAGGVLLNLAIGAAVRATGLPGIVASVLNLLIGSARRSAGTTTVESRPGDPGAFAPTAFGDLLRDRDPWAEPTAQARAESAARGVRIDALLSTFEDTGDDVMIPSAVQSGVPEEQALPSPGIETETDAPYGGGEAPAMDVPGPEAAGDVELE